MKIDMFGKGKTLRKVKLEKDIAKEQKSKWFPVIVIVIGIGMIVIGVMSEMGVI